MKKIYSVFGICLGVFLGGPMAGAYFISKNFEQFGDHEASKAAIRIGLIASLGFFAAMLLLPPKVLAGIPNFLFPIIFVWITRFLVNRYQKDQLAEFINTGGARESNWKAAGISLVIALLTVIVGVSMSLVADLFAPGA